MSRRHSERVKRSTRGGETKGSADSPSAPARRRVWVLLAVFLGLLVAAWLSGGFAYAPRALARRALENRDFQAAWRHLGWAESLSRSDPANSLLAARIARWQQDGKRFAEAYAMAERRGAASDDLRRERLLHLAQRGELEPIEAELVRSLADAGADAAEISDAYVNGLTMHARFDDAATVLEGWQLDFPDDPRPEYRIGRLQEHREMFPEAEASYRRALARKASYYPARYSLGRLLLRDRRAAEAEAEFRACLTMPQPEAAMVELAIALKAQGKAEQARPLLQQAAAADASRMIASYQILDESPERLKAASELGQLETDAGNFAEAERWLALALEANPLDVSARYALAVSLRALGKKEQAEAQFGRVESARKAMRKAQHFNSRILANPADVEARCELGRMVLENESERKGLFLIQSVFAYDPDYRPAHEALASYFEKRARRQPDYAVLAEHHRRKAAASPPRGKASSAKPDPEKQAQVP